MEISDLLSIGALVAALNMLLGIWVKSRIESSIKHEYDRRLEELKNEGKRRDVLYVERLTAFKSLHKRLISLRRYCEAQVNDERGSDLLPGTEALTPDDNKSCLVHLHLIDSTLDETGIFLSGETRSTFDELRRQLSLGARLEIWLSDKDIDPEVVASKASCYQAIAARVDISLGSVYKDLGFPHEA